MKRLIGILLFGITTLAATVVVGQPIVVVPCPNPLGCGTFAFRDQRTPNTIGLTVGDRISLGVEVTPNPGLDNTNVVGQDTVVVATQGSAQDMPVYTFSPAFPNQFFGSVAYNSSLTGSWTLTITNPNSVNSPVTVSTLPIGDVPVVDFVTSMMLSPGPTSTQPTFTWALPPPATFTSASIRLFDLDHRTPSGSAPAIHARSNLPLSTTSYTVPAILSGGGSLEPGTNYAVSIQLDQQVNGVLVSRSRSIFNFQPVETGTPPVALPSVGSDGNYHFNVAVVGGQTTFIDPPVAVGYDYAIGPGDPNFASVLLPDVGDGVYDVFAKGVHSTVLAGQQFLFPQGGVAQFSVRGIDMSAGLDPANILAFVTGLTFVESGHFTGTMTPIVQFVPGIGATPRAIKLASAGQLGDLLPTGDPQTDKKLAAALDHLNKSLEPGLWQDDTHLTNNGEKVFSEEREAVNKLMEIKSPPAAFAAEIAAVIQALVGADQALAQRAIMEATAALGDPGTIAKALHEMDKAASEIAKGNFDNAIAHYKHAWQQAQKA